jgi:hypothetical protein
MSTFPMPAVSGEGVCAASVSAPYGSRSLPELIAIMKESTPSAEALELFTAVSAAAAAAGDSGQLSDQALNEYFDFFLSMDRATQANTAAKLRLWKLYIPVVKRLQQRMHAGTAAALLACLCGYVEGGARSLLEATDTHTQADTSCAPPSAGISNLLDILMFFVQRLGVTLLFLVDALPRRETCLALLALAACRGAFARVGGAEALTQVFHRIAFSRTSPRNSEKLADMFCACAALQLRMDLETYSLRDTDTDTAGVACRAYAAAALHGCALLWASLFPDLADPDPTLPLPAAHRQRLLREGVRSAVACVDALCVLQSGAVSDRALVDLCRAIGHCCAVGIGRGEAGLEVYTPHTCAMHCYHAMQGNDNV